IRDSHPGTPATVTSLENHRARIRLHEPQRAITPGQAAVIYDGDVVVGGGWICRGEPPRHFEPARRTESLVPACQMAERVLLALSTFPDRETAQRISNQVVTEKFAACANILPAVESIYRWKDKVETGNETLVIFKLGEDRQAA